MEDSRWPELSRLLNTRINNVLRCGHYNEDLDKLAKDGPRELLRFRNMGFKSLEVLAPAMEKLGLIPSAEKWMKTPEHVRQVANVRLTLIRMEIEPGACHLCGEEASRLVFNLPFKKPVKLCPSCLNRGRTLRERVIRRGLV